MFLSNINLIENKKRILKKKFKYFSGITINSDEVSVTDSEDQESGHLQLLLLHPSHVPQGDGLFQVPSLTPSAARTPPSSCPSTSATLRHQQSGVGGQTSIYPPSTSV